MGARSSTPAGWVDWVRWLSDSSGQGYLKILDACPDAVLAVDADATVVFVNRTSEKLFGHPRSDLLGRSLHTLVPPPWDEPDGRTGVRHDGSTFPAQVSFIALDRPAAPAWVVVVRDQTLEHRRLQAIERSHHLQERSRSNAKRFWQGFDRLSTALSRSELLGRTSTQVLGAGADGDLLRPGANPVDGRERQLRRADGVPIWVTVSSSLVRDDDGDPDYLLVGPVLDITQRRRQQQSARRRAERDRRISDVLRAGLSLAVPQSVGPARVATRYRPAVPGERLGGDWHDVFVLPDGRVGFTIGDVAGHGTEAAATMVRLRYAARMLAIDGVPPAGVVSRLNEVMQTADPRDSEIATVIHGQLDVERNQLVYCSAGHLPLLALSESAQAQPIGVVADLAYAEQPVELEAGTVLVGYTDGLLERRGHDLMQTLHSLIRGLQNLSPHDLADPETVTARILDLAPPGDRTDDTALLVLAPRSRPRPQV